MSDALLVQAAQKVHDAGLRRDEIGKRQARLMKELGELDVQLAKAETEYDDARQALIAACTPARDRCGAG